MAEPTIRIYDDEAIWDEMEHLEGEACKYKWPGNTNREVNMRTGYAMALHDLRQRLGMKERTEGEKK